jgi:SAM-dependent methyltransferase
LSTPNRKIQQWDRWLESFPGQAVLQAEKNFLPSLLGQLYGCHALLIGTPQQNCLLESSVIPNQLLLSPVQSHLHANTTMRSLESSLHELAIASGSIDLVLLPHMLEYVDNPRQTIAEACRIVKPQGHIVIFGFNPFSLWGVKKLFTKEATPPWTGTFIQPASIQKWLALADFKLVNHKAFLFRPPLQQESLYKKLKFMEWIGRKLHVLPGGVYLIIAQAKVIPLTPIRVSYQHKLSDLRLPIIGIPKHSIRNRH